MVGTLLRVIGAAALGAAVAGSFMITRYLALLEAGIDQDVRTVARIVEVQQAVMEQNQALEEVAAATASIGRGLDQVLAATEAIHANVLGVKEANRSTLAINNAMEVSNGVAAREMARVAASLGEMNGAAGRVEGELAALRATTAADVDWLDAIRFNTAAMNARTPGW